MPKYSKGDIVKISFEATVTDEDGLTMDGSLNPSSYFLVKDNGAGFNHAMFNAAIGHGITVDMVTPVDTNWPPKENDVWKSASRTYHYVGGSFRVHSISGEVTSISNTEVRSRAGLRLVYRNL